MAVAAQVRSRSAIRLEVGPLYAALLACLAFLRVATTNAIHVMFVDDAIFLERARWSGPWDAITFPRSGYLNLAPMSVVQAFEWVPDPAIPITYIAVSSTVVGLLGWFVADASRAFLTSTAAQMTVGAAVALIPVAAVESVGTLSNFQWYLMAAATFALACRVQTGVAVAVVVLAALSAPAAVMLAPLVAWHRHRAMVVGWSAAISIQLLVIAVRWGDRESTGGAWLEVNDATRSFVVWSLNGATSYTRSAFEPSLLTICSLVLVGAAIAIRRTDVTVVALLVGGSAAQWWFTYSVGSPYGTDPRYVVAPAIIAASCIVWAAEQLGRRVLWASIFVLCVAWATGFQAADFRALTGDDWRQQLAENPCVDGARTLDPAPDLVTTPMVELPC